MGVNSLQWYYLPNLGNMGELVALGGDEWHHCYHVFRLTSGDSIILTDGKGKCMEGIIKSGTQKEGQIELTFDRQTAFRNPRHYQLTIGIAPTKNIDRTEFAVEKLVELGVDEICFLECQHGERHRIRMDRFEKLIISAAKQSKKINFPVLHNLMNPADFIGQKRTVSPEVNILCCHLDSSSKSLPENYSAGSNVVMLIGPEGGFAPEELNMMLASNVHMVHLGPFRLRVETAAIAACAGIHLLNEMKITS